MISEDFHTVCSFNYTHVFIFSSCVPQPWRKLSRFPAASDNLSDVELDTREMVRAQNKKKKKSGGFQSMGKIKEEDLFIYCLLLGNAASLFFV